ncbi:hypothetical protein [Anaerostipes sp. 992a]|uniref:hypothetical protein n=1 Tax=Anaerostipes sp. 992a TaxID=1261637 RepID=UPI0013016739|nr:hypothetical protein [Anaerostipes sp. 992a]
MDKKKMRFWIGMIVLAIINSGLGELNAAYRESLETPVALVIVVALILYMSASIRKK